MAPRKGLTEARERVGLAQEELGEQVGVVGRTVSLWERGRQGIKPEYRSALARALQISLFELDRLIRGEPLYPSRIVLIADGDPGTRWLVDIDRLARRNFQWVPPPAALPILNPGDDGLQRARRHLHHLASAIRISPGPGFGRKQTGVEFVITCGALAEILADRTE